MAAYVISRTDPKTDLTEFITETRFTSMSDWHCTWEWKPGTVKVFYEYSSWKEIQAQYAKVGVTVERVIIY